jgi:hypothetical protein
MNDSMKMAVRLVALLVVSAPAFAQSPASTPAPASKSRDGVADRVRPAEQDVVYEGELETHIAIGGESTGWRLRRRTPQGRREYIEVLLTADVAQGVRANTRVQVRGTMKTRHYAERGDVDVLVAKSVVEVARTR